MWHRFLWKWKWNDFAFEKTISGSYLKQNNSDLVFQTRTIFLEWVSNFIAGHVTKMRFLKFINYLFLNTNLHLNFKENVEKMKVYSTSERSYQTFNKI